MVISAVHKSCNSYIDRGAYDNIAPFQDFFRYLLWHRIWIIPYFEPLIKEW